MRKEKDELGSLEAFAAVARTGSFTKAAGRLGTSQSALSHMVRRLEQRLGIRLLNRTTRSVAPTQAGRDLLETLEPALRDIRRRLETLTAASDGVAGTVRLTTPDHAAETLVWPVLRELLPDHPSVKVELDVENDFVDIVAEHYDAGIRLGDNVARDMIAVPIGPEERTVVAAAPSYLADHPAPTTLGDLLSHSCIVRTLPKIGGVAPWEFERNGRRTKARVDGRLTFNRSELVIEATVAGFGLAQFLRSQVENQLSSAALVEVLADWSVALPGYHLYFPSRRQPTAAFQLVLQALRRS
ncbi:LysR family transcriptional regulator [Aureimonas altamirensis]|uniref:LysR family transcriptional regulator n=1 Tax=Aureimonas altamirensis TaxID=370622 RepID=UPI001E318482|nr:LysR family transcriptional regulator [Aureimonas altamirensis]UHD46402.1 LysR family transcriptional regulator [Aureimonas altamirensis]